MQPDNKISIIIAVFDLLLQPFSDLLLLAKSVEPQAGLFKSADMKPLSLDESAAASVKSTSIVGTRIRSSAAAASISHETS